MPRRKQAKRLTQRELIEGQGLFDSLGKFLKKTKLISRSGNILGKIGVPYAGTVGKVAGATGYGRRTRRGGGLVLAGAGPGRKKKAQTTRRYPPTRR